MISLHGFLYVGLLSFGFGFVVAKIEAHIFRDEER